MRDYVRRLTKQFYSGAHQGSKHSDDNSSQSSTDANTDAAQRGAEPHGFGPRVSSAHAAHRVLDLPLWRAPQVVVPGMQNLLHVHTPHHVHMFNELFGAGPGPYRFGHLYLPLQPGAPRGGASAQAPPGPPAAPGPQDLTPGSQAPLVGVLLEVTRAVRLMDGKLLVLATALGRFKVSRCTRESPFYTADVEYYGDAEELEAWHHVGLHAALDTADTLSNDGCSIDTDYRHPPLPSKPPLPAAALAPTVSEERPGSPHVAALKGDGAYSAASPAPSLGLPAAAAASSPPSSSPVSSATGAAPGTAGNGADRAAAPVGGMIWTSSLEEDAAGGQLRSFAGAGAGPGPGAPSAVVHPAATQPVRAEVPAQQQQPEFSEPAAVSIDSVMSAALAATTAAAAAATTIWQEYELATAREQAWGGDLPREGADEASTTGLVHELVNAGIMDVLAVQDGAIIGRRWDLAALEERAQSTAEAAAAACSRATLKELCRTTHEGGGAALHDGMDGLQQAPGGVSLGVGSSGLNTVGERGLRTGLPWPKDEELALSGDSTHDMLRMEQLVWEELDAVALLAVRSGKPKLSLPFGLLQLRPPPGPSSSDDEGHPGGLPSSSWRAASSASASSHASGASSGSSSGASSHPAGSDSADIFTPLPFNPKQAASEGSEAHADPAYPALRRVQRLSYSMAVTMEPSLTEQRQALLEGPSVVGRLKLVLAHLRKHRKVLAAVAAIEEVKRQQHRPPGGQDAGSGAKP